MPRSPSVQIAHRRLWTLVLRIAVLCLGLQSIGLGHALSDIYSVASGAALHANAECPDDESDTDCPPGCPTCHCSHAPVFSLPQPVLQMHAVALPAEGQSAAWDAATVAPQQAHLDALFRPPRCV